MNNTSKLGNDIVDFSLAENQNKFLNRRFLNRVFSELEIKAIDQSQQKDRLIWSLWAAKEAAFKAYQKLNFDLAFSPRQFEVTQPTLMKLRTFFDATILGELTHHQQLIAVKWQWPDQYCVHACAVTQIDNQCFQAWHQIKQACERAFSQQDQDKIHHKQSQKVRQLLFKLATKHYQFNAPLSIQRSQILIKGHIRKSPPVLYQGQNLLPDIEISLSHDHLWIAASILALTQTPPPP